MPLSWKQLTATSGVKWPADKTNGPTNSQSELRLFGRSKEEEEVHVTLFRDNHAWCPYCQKVWMFLEEKREKPRPSGFSEAAQGHFF